LISAPAGFGKTTLLSGWINGYSIPVAWFSIEACLLSAENNDKDGALAGEIAAIRARLAVPDKIQA